MDWQPIETAPKDGTVIVASYICDDDIEMSFAVQWGHIQRNPLFAPDQVGMWVTPCGKATWSDTDGGGPTHWMPLPDPPQ